MSSRTVKFGAGGDIMLAGQIAPLMQEKGTMWPFEPMLPVLQRADLLFGNLESVVMPPDYPLDQKDPAALASTAMSTPIGGNGSEAPYSCRLSATQPAMRTAACKTATSMHRTPRALANRPRPSRSSNRSTFRRH